MSFVHFFTNTVLDADWPIPVTDGTGQRQFRRAYQITNLPALYAGDLIVFSGHTEIVNPTAYNIQICDELTLGNMPNWNWDAPSAGPGVLMPPSGSNVAAANHYGTPRLFWQWQVPTDQPSGWSTEWRMYAQSSSAVGALCPILQGYGGMQVTIFRAG